MSDTSFEQLKNLSLEIRSLIRQGVREGVDERIQQRNQLLKEWFSRVQDLITLTNEQQDFLEDLLKEEQSLLNILTAEQKQLANHEKGKKHAAAYSKIARH